MSSVDLSLLGKSKSREKIVPIFPISCHGIQQYVKN